MDLDHELNEEDDDLLDGCGGAFGEPELPEEEEDLFVLFAEALDPETDVTVEQVADMWRQRQ